jgi:hypothetical protein
MEKAVSVLATFTQCFQFEAFTSTAFASRINDVANPNWMKDVVIHLMKRIHPDFCLCTVCVAGIVAALKRSRSSRLVSVRGMQRAASTVR